MSTTESVFRESRPQFFANRVLRLAIKTALAQELGPDCLALLCVVAMTEDARRYRGPVTFWNDQLLPLVGFSKWERLDKARKATVTAGWLAYEPGGRHKPGRYRVTIPAELQDVEDAAVDESKYPAQGYQAGDQESLDLPQTDSNTEAEGDIKPESRRVSTGGASRTSTGVTSLPVPEPVPSPVPKPETVAADAAGDSSRKLKAKTQQPIPIPRELDTPAARKALDEFKEHRRQKRKALTPLAEQKLLENWSTKGPDRFVAAVNHSIANGWQGLFEPNKSINKHQGKPEMFSGIEEWLAEDSDASALASPEGIDPASVLEVKP